MKFNSLLLGFASLAILGGAGCAGSGAVKPSFATGNLNFSGAEQTTDTSTAPATVPATGGTTITTAGGVTAVIPSGSVPGGTTLPAGTIFVIIPAGVGFAGTTPAGGQLVINSVTNSGALVGLNGLLSVNVAIPVTPGPDGTLYSISFPNASLSTSRALTVQNIEFTGKFYILANPLRVVSPVPVGLEGSLPNNGQNAAGSNVLATFASGNNGRSANLFVDYGTGFKLNQTRSVASLQTRFTNLRFDSQNVPQNGVRLVRFIVGDL